MVAAAKPVVEAKNGYGGACCTGPIPSRRVIDRKVVVDHAARSMTVDWRIDTGPMRVSTGDHPRLQSIDRDFVQARPALEAGQPFDGGKVDEGRRTRSTADSFLRSRLPMPTRSTRRPSADDRDGHREQASLDRGGVTYSTSEGPGGKAFWEHRNLFGAGERLTLTLRVSEIQGATADFRKPD